ncbi:MAG: ferritin-like domain-containing protein [Thiobacillus sp.]|nr:ferritin-like domain-containing protein [Thiobacillus sp.]
MPQRLAACLCAAAPADKVNCVRALRADWLSGTVDAATEAARDGIAAPGRPVRPALVLPHQVPRRRIDTLAGRAALVHALAHIEFNAINLALDAAHRFAGMPREYYDDWLRVADEEALHFSLLAAHLETLGHAYGDLPAHNGLWDMALKTAHDPLVRMALVPRVLEARGLDATPLIVAKLRAANDTPLIGILAIVERDEIGHVAIGNHWYGWLCERRGLDPAATFRRLLQEYDAPPLRPPFNLAARRQAGFGEDELAWMASL